MYGKLYKIIREYTTQTASSQYFFAFFLNEVLNKFKVVNIIYLMAQYTQKTWSKIYLVIGN